MKRFHSTKFGSILTAAAAFTLLVVLPAPSLQAAAMFDCDDDGNFCLDRASGAKWEPGEKSTAADRRGRSKRNGGTISLTIENGRGSMFSNGRYVGTAPFDDLDILSGVNDVQVRDGAEVIAEGLLTVPVRGSVTATVHHP